MPCRSTLFIFSFNLNEAVLAIIYKNVTSSIAYCILATGGRSNNLHIFATFTDLTNLFVNLLFILFLYILGTVQKT